MALVFEDRFVSQANAEVTGPTAQSSHEGNRPPTGSEQGMNNGQHLSDTAAALHALAQMYWAGDSDYDEETELAIARLIAHGWSAENPVPSADDRQPLWHTLGEGGSLVVTQTNSPEQRLAALRDLPALVANTNTTVYHYWNGVLHEVIRFPNVNESGSSSGSNSRTTSTQVSATQGAAHQDDQPQTAPEQSDDHSEEHVDLQQSGGHQSG